MNCMYGCSDCVGTRHGKIRNWLSYVSDACAEPQKQTPGASEPRSQSGEAEFGSLEQFGACGGTGSFWSSELLLENSELVQA